MNTEQEVKQMWCPMSRQLGTLIGRRDATEDDRTVAMGSQNRGYSMGGALDNCMCLASKCAMWRWSDTTLEYHWGDTPTGEGWKDNGIKERWVAGSKHEPTRLWERLHTARRGFCGLAGKPEV